MSARLGRLTPYLYLAPMVGLVGVFLLYPAADTVWTSLTDSTGIGKAHFIGIDNYTALVHDPAFKTSFVNTLYWVAGVLVLQVGLGLALAPASSGTSSSTPTRGSSTALCACSDSTGSRRAGS